MTKIASVIVNNPSKNVDKEFDYIIPSIYEEIIKVGMRIVVPFGNGNKLLEAYVLDIKDKQQDSIKYKVIHDIIDVDVLFSTEMIQIAYFLKSNYHCTLSEALRLIMPSGTTLKESIYIRLINNDLSNINKKYHNLLLNLSEERFIELKALNKLVSENISRGDIFNLEKLGIIEIKRDMIQNVNIKKAYVYHINETEECKDFMLNPPPRVKKQAEILNLISINKYVLTLGELCGKLNCSPGIIKALEEKKYLIKSERELYRNPFNLEYEYKKVRLTMDQTKAIEEILEGYNKGKNISLIHGVTGCGKTEIYLTLIENFIKEGKSAIVLVPEIALTPQTVERFKGRFGDIVAVLHSRLSEGEKFDEWRRIKKGKVEVVVGARSAVFAPINNLKIIIIDEEHEYSYKSDITPKYLTREVAEYRVNYNNGLLVLGSATPSLESYYKASNNISI